ncbi:hypothetical protein EOI86_06020 [Hwanghaeella grinnelliae]|uniref:PEP-CTERM sorting domain-containing protein n=1 Tax=Hwanghaeella grinnelliae TaxID=2500179 RepID=A0A437QWC4_9PROT|nr:hypothetical protein [Hwanghaeella grinnelliae]RVU38822.1 hypothetical protein EOI86_06020 [Hwanghaeella grinnelliae]
MFRKVIAFSVLVVLSGIGSTHAATVNFTAKISGFSGNLAALGASDGDSVSGSLSFDDINPLEDSLSKSVYNLTELTMSIGSVFFQSPDPFPAPPFSSANKLRINNDIQGPTSPVPTDTAEISVQDGAFAANGLFLSVFNMTLFANSSAIEDASGTPVVNLLQAIVGPAATQRSFVINVGDEQGRFSGPSVGFSDLVFSGDENVSTVPVPPALGLLAIGLAALGSAKKQRTSVRMRAVN